MYDIWKAISDSPEDSTIIGFALCIMFYAYQASIKDKSENKIFLKGLFFACFVVIIFFAYRICSKDTNVSSTPQTCFNQEIEIYLIDLEALFDEIQKRQDATRQLALELRTMNRFQNYQEWTCKDKKNALKHAKKYLVKILTENNFIPNHSIKIISHEI